MAMAIRQFNSKVVPVLGYVAQPVPSREIVRSELTEILRALSVAGSSMKSQIALRLKQWVGIDSIRPSAYMTAAMVRAASKTVVVFEWTHQSLIECAEYALNLCVLSSPTTVPPGWDSEAFCTNLLNASNLTLSGPYSRAMPRTAGPGMIFWPSSGSSGVSPVRILRRRPIAS